MLGLINALGIVATVGLILFYIPQVITIYRAPKLSGFNLPAWFALWVAVVALTIQAGLLNIWTAMAANVPGSFAVGYIILQVIRKKE